MLLIQIYVSAKYKPSSGYNVTKMKYAIYAESILLVKIKRSFIVIVDEIISCLLILI